MHEIYCILCDLIASLECESEAQLCDVSTPKTLTRASERHLGEVADLRARSATAHANYEAASKRIGQRWFLPGVWIGIVAALFLIGAFTAATMWQNWDEIWVATASAGAAGAVVSVLQRMTAGSLAVCAEADRLIVTAIGVCRVALGITLGVVSYVLINGGLVPLDTPTAGTRTLFFAGLAFIAAFSERFARDMLAAPTHLLDGLKTGKPAPAPTAAPATH